MIDINELRPAVEAAGLNAISVQEVLELLGRLESAESDALEQARLNGMGASREAALMAKLEVAEKERDFAKTEIARLHDDIRELTDVRVLDKEDRELWATLKAKSAEKERDNANAAAVGIALQAKKLEAERDELRAKIEQMEKQEPIAWLDDGTCRAGSEATAHRVVTNETRRDMPASVAASFSVPLYALPGAKGE